MLSVEARDRVEDEVSNRHSHMLTPQSVYATVDMHATHADDADEAQLQIAATRVFQDELRLVIDLLFRRILILAV